VTTAFTCGSLRPLKLLTIFCADDSDRWHSPSDSVPGERAGDHAPASDQVSDRCVH